jgi:meso-butanediol dehydrogenase / (S,S)-butanediol dehydrogenase / diacetyl reductase
VIDGGRPVAVVTGGGRGIGRAIANGLADAGYDLVLGWRNDGGAIERAVNYAEKAGGSAVSIRGDVTNPSASDALAAAASEVFGRLDVWVNNAGISVLVPLLETEPGDARRQIEVNYLGTLFGVIAAGRVMTSVGSGRIINVASDLGVHAAPLLAAYSASKFAVVGVTQAAAVELAPFGVTVNALCPGTVETDMVLAEERAEAAVTGRDLDEVRARMLATVPAGRWCTAEDVAASVLYLCSPGAAFVTGQAICINGGSILH